jgi:tetratricopeptide (TPR) repeat protein
MKRVVYGSLLAALGAALVIRARWEGEQRARVYDRLGMAYFKQGDLGAADRELRREIRLTRANALAHYKLGIIDLQRGQPQQARDALTEAIALGTDQPRAYCALGLAAFRMSDYGAAIAPLQRCIARNPDDDDARYLLAASYLGQARLDEAERDFKELLQREPKNSRFLYSLGTVYLYRPATAANNAAALAALRQAVALGNAPAGAFYTLGLVCRRAGRWQEAAAALGEALRRDPRMLEARQPLGLVYRRLGKEKEANEQFRIARAQAAAAQRDRRLTYLQGEATRNPMNPLVHFQLAALYDELKENAAARAEYETAAALDSRMPDPHDRLAEVDVRLGKTREAQRERALAQRLRQAQTMGITAPGR